MKHLAQYHFKSLIKNSGAINNESLIERYIKAVVALILLLQFPLQQPSGILTGFPAVNVRISAFELESRQISNETEKRYRAPYILQTNVPRCYSPVTAILV